jgi:hypothetical protein
MQRAGSSSGTVLDEGGYAPVKPPGRTAPLELSQRRFQFPGVMALQLLRTCNSRAQGDPVSSLQPGRYVCGQFLSTELYLQRPIGPSIGEPLLLRK